MRVYPVFTDGKKFIHCSELHLPKECRTAYFTKYKLKEWEKIEKPTLIKQQAQKIWNNWTKMSKETSHAN
jgi:hypothetical protein